MDQPVTALPRDPTCTDPMVVNCVAYSADGKKLRDMMPWIKANRLVDKSKN